MLESYQAKTVTEFLLVVLNVQPKPAFFKTDILILLHYVESKNVLSSVIILDVYDTKYV